jgi:hypothetical protein
MLAGAAEANMVPTVITSREFLAMHACDFMFGRVVRIVDDAIYA